MPEEINVIVVRYNDRSNLLMRYTDPGTGRRITRSTGTTKHPLAVKVAAKWEAELREGRYQRTSRMAWLDFRDQFEDATAPRQRASTRRGYSETLNAFENCCNPKTVGDLTTIRVNAFIAHLREPKERHNRKGEVVGVFTRSEATIARHLRHLKATARWANRMGLLPRLPVFDMPTRSKSAKMKGRPITTEEFERMLAATEKVVGDDAAESWKFLLQGLWATGLRLGEAMALRWDHVPGGVSVDLDGPHSVLVFDAEAQKSGRDELVPLTPEAVQLLEPMQRQRGWVFQPQRIRGDNAMARHALKIGKIIGKIGAKAQVVTEPAKGRTATAHDLRRTFGCRWAKRVMPAVLRDLMRHADISTTLIFYARENARTTAAQLWAAAGIDDGGNRRGNIQGATAMPRSQTP